MKNLFKKLNWVQWLIIVLFICLTVLGIFIMSYFGSAISATKGTLYIFSGREDVPDSFILECQQGLNKCVAYLSLLIIAYVILTAFLALVFIREFKKNKEKV